MTAATPDCQEIRHALGVYVLGAIDPAERTIVDNHLASCPACRDELAALAGLPALLGRVNEPQLTEIANAPGGDDELLTNLLARAQARIPMRRRRPRPRLLPLAAAAAVILIAGTMLGLTLRGESADVPAAVPTITAPLPANPIPTTTRTAERIVAEDPRTHVKVELGLWPTKGGTSMSVHVTGVPVGTGCHLIAYGLDGSKDTAAGWRIPEGGYGEYRGSTMISRDELDHLKIITRDGRVLITVPT